MKKAILSILLSLLIVNCSFSSKAGKVMLEDPSLNKGMVGDFIYIPAGEYMRGNSKSALNDPAHKVIISNSFEIGKCEITQKQWEAIMGNNPSYFKGADLPEDTVSWEDANEFVSKLNNKSSKYIYRLPTEAEWEYACRAGTTEDYAGDLDSMAWYVKNSGDQTLIFTEAYVQTHNDMDAKINANHCRTHPVGQKKPNAWGLYDMYGNVWEWCSDWDGKYPSEAVIDPKGPNSGTSRVLRGGSWGFSANSCTSSNRNSMSPDYHNTYAGLRLVRMPRH